MKVSHYKCWDVDRLQDEECAEKYRSTLAIGSNALLELSAHESALPSDISPDVPADLWSRVQSLMANAASSSLPVQREILSPRRSKAKLDYHVARTALSKRPHDVKLQDAVRVAKEDVERLKDSHVADECTSFFRGIT